MRQLFFMMSAVAFVAMAGCGGDGLQRVDIQGKVTAKDGPVANATVVFSPMDTGKGAVGAIGTSDKDGAFTLISSRREDKGVVAGKYKVRVSRLMDKDGSILPNDAKQADFPNAKESIPEPYSSPDSPLEVTIPATGGAVLVELPVKTITKK